MSAKDVAEISRIFVDVLPSKVKARDIEGYVNLFTEDAAWCPPNAPDRFGQAGVREGVTTVLSTQNIDPTFFVEEAKVIQSTGYVFGRSTEKLMPLDGSPSTVVYSRELWLFRKVEGDWKISHLIFNMKPGPNE